MILDNYILGKISAMINTAVKGKRIKASVTFEQGRFLIILEDDSAIEYSMVNGLEHLRYSNNFRPPSKNLVSLLHSANEKTITEITCLPDDKVIAMTLSDNLKMYFVFVSSKKNVLLVNENTIIDSFKDSKLIVNQSFKQYLPETSPGKISTVKDYLSQKYFHFNKYIRQSIISDMKLNMNDEISGKIEEELKSSFDFQSNVINENYFLYKTGKEIFVSPIKCNDEKLELLIQGNSFNDLYEEALRVQYRLFKEYNVKNVVLSKKQKELENVEKKIRSLHVHYKTCENSDSMLNSGNLILANINRITPGDKELVCENYDGTEIKIKLKPDKKPSENAQYYFDKYKGQKESLRILDSRIKLLLQTKLNLEKELSAIQSADDLKSINKMEKNFNQEKSTEEVSKLFRKFPLSDKYEVWVGKDSRSNDLLTTKYSSPHDLWFHVRGASGSHTVLRLHNKGEVVEKEFIKIAAAIAAYYSKSRNASNVMVAYCERKFVKKKKGMKSGSVIMEREKVVTVKPGLPEMPN